MAAGESATSCCLRPFLQVTNSFHILVTLLLLTFHFADGAFMAVMQGDKDANLFVTGKYLNVDNSMSVLLMNGVRQVSSSGDPKFYSLSQTLVPGDVIAISVSSKREYVNITSPTGEITTYPNPVGVILATLDGVMTTRDWRCGTEQKINDILFYDRRFDDTSWEVADEQADDCCPWRDPAQYWNRLNAKWIGLKPPPGNKTGYRNFMCRTVIGNYSRLPTAETINASDTAPVVNVTSLQVATSLTLFTFTVSAPAVVYCGVIDARYQLRTPTHNELKSWGVGTGRVVAGPDWLLQAAGPAVTSQEINATYIANYTNVSQATCTSFCRNNSQCKAMQYYLVGSDFITSANCKLYDVVYDANNLKAAVTYAAFRFFNVFIRYPVYTLSVGGDLLPGTLYNSFCSAENATGFHSNISAIGATQRTARTEGCFGCTNDPPIVNVLGGFASSRAVTVIVQATRPGRIFCSASGLTKPNAVVGLSATEIRAFQNFNILTIPNRSVSVGVGDLVPSTLYEVACVAEADGGLMSTDANIASTHRRWYTEAVDPTINSMTLERLAVGTSDNPMDAINVNIQITATGYFWCFPFITAGVVNSTVPSIAQLKQVVKRTRVPSIIQNVGASYGGIRSGVRYEVYCTAEYNDLLNDTDTGTALSPYPTCSIISIDVGYDFASLRVFVNKGPARVFCQAFQWAFRPQTLKPPPPKQFAKLETNEYAMYKSPFMKELEIIAGGYVNIEIAPLVAGTYYDVYCYSETIQPPPPPGVLSAEREGMPDAAILATRNTISTKGPVYNDLGWQCVAGQACQLPGLVGLRLSNQDKVLVRADLCPGKCKCAGIVDSYRKGGSCSVISQDPKVVAGAGESDAQDPRGAWCYVQNEVCEDTQPSLVFPDMRLSYKVCSYNHPVGALSGRGPHGFPNGGVPTTSSNGTSFSFGDKPMIPYGLKYQVCWCNGAESKCNNELDFRLEIGNLHMAGPDEEQTRSTDTCIAGMPCAINFFGGHGISDGSRLVALPEDPRGCFWDRATLGDPLGIPGFPNLGVSEPYVAQFQRGFNWTQAPIIVDGGVYQLCWCGPASAALVQVPGREYVQPSNATPEWCPSVRPIGGGNFIVPAGKLRVIGPVPKSTSYCKLGVPCLVANVRGEGLQGSDKLAVLLKCGEAVASPFGWVKGVQDLGAGWVEGGWGTRLSLPGRELAGLGAPSITGNSTVPTVPSIPRGVYGVPNYGFSSPDPRPGYYLFDGQTWALAGTYTLCWCGNSSGCQDSRQFLVSVGQLKITGPEVYPLAAQMRRCVRGRACEILNFKGTQPAGSRFLIASAGCGSPGAFAAPQNGISDLSEDGSHYSWGTSPLNSAPGQYTLCWCSTLTGCTLPEMFQSFSGILQVKGPTETPGHWYCPLNEPCTIDGVVGEGLDNNDKVMILVVCGQGNAPTGFTRGAQSNTTLDDGSTFLLPPAIVGGNYRVCWCAGESVCNMGIDFFVDLGDLAVAGPDAAVTYLCYEWQPCEIPELKGLTLGDGDRLLAVPDGTDCSRYNTNTTPPAQDGFPRSGVSLPATGNGTRYSWGTGLIRTTPGMYALCWCQNESTPGGCNERGPFNVQGGAIRIGTSKQYQYDTRVPDPQPRSNDTYLALLLVVPLPILLCAAIWFGIRRLSVRRGSAEPEAPPIFSSATYRLSEKQQREKTVADVRSVMETRESVAKGSAAKYQGKNVFQEMVLALFGLFRLQQTKVEPYRGGKDLSAPSKSRPSAQTLDSEAATTAGSDDFPHFIDDRGAAYDLEGGDRSPGGSNSPSTGDPWGIARKGEGLPDPPDLTFRCVNDPRLLNLLDLDDMD